MAAAAQTYTKSNFFHALHMQESSGKLKAPAGDNGKALGPFQIWQVYFADSGVKGKYEQICCTVQDSKTVVDGYMKRYAKNEWSDAMNMSQVEKCARIHNGGPNGHTKQATVQYWNQFKAHLSTKKQCQNNVACTD